MPRLSCWFIKASFLHLAVGAVFGGLMLSAKGQPQVFGWAWRLLPAHIQIMLGGWLIQLALGMAYWILPRLGGKSRERERPRAAWLSFVALNSGVTGTGLLLAFRPFVVWPWLGVLLVAAGLLQILALGAFAWHAWPRVHPVPLRVT